MHDTIKAIYDLFKPLPQTKVWGDSQEVCISWERVPGYSRYWIDECGELRFAFIRTEQ